jgi:hypothetical protein
MLFPIAHFAAVDTWGKSSGGQFLIGQPETRVPRPTCTVTAALIAKKASPEARWLAPGFWDAKCFRAGLGRESGDSVSISGQ